MSTTTSRPPREAAPPGGGGWGAHGSTGFNDRLASDDPGTERPGPQGGAARDRLGKKYLLSALGFAGTSLAAAEDACRETFRVSDPEVGQSLTALGEMRGQIERMLLRLVVEADERGLPSASGLSLHDWVQRRCPW